MHPNPTRRHSRSRSLSSTSSAGAVALAALVLAAAGLLAGRRDAPGVPPAEPAPRARGASLAPVAPVAPVAPGETAGGASLGAWLARDAPSREMAQALARAQRGELPAEQLFAAACALARRDGAWSVRRQGLWTLHDLARDARLPLGLRRRARDAARPFEPPCTAQRRALAEERGLDEFGLPPELPLSLP